MLMKVLKGWLIVTGFLMGTTLSGQDIAPLSVEKIMRDPNLWMGTSPAAIRWSEDSQVLYFNWNPDKNKVDSLYAYAVATRKITKVGWAEQKKLPDNGVYNRARTLKVYAKNGDLFLADCRNNTVQQLTNTVAAESQPVFSGDESQVVFIRDGNLFGMNLANGLNTQYTDFREGSKKEDLKGNKQEEWLRSDQLSLFEILKERKEKKDAGEVYTKLLKPERPREIYLGEKKVQHLRISPDLGYVTYSLVQTPKTGKTAIVPNYVTDSGFTENLTTRTKVGAPPGSYEFWVYDRGKDTTRKVPVANVPGIYEQPDYLRDYPERDTARKQKEREVYFTGPFYSPGGKHAVVVVRSQDNKDRWIMALQLSDLSLTLLDRQRDEAWIGGPGTGGAMSGGNLGWIREELLYYQSEESGYSHLYTVELTTGKKTALTSGKFEVQQAWLSNDKQHFYLITNEVHPGEQHFYKMPVTGGPPVRLTTQEGAHEVTLSPDESKVAIRYSNSNTPWELFVAPNTPQLTLTRVTESVTEEFRSYPWRKPKVVTIPASDGASVYARVYEPVRSNGKAVIFVHGAGYLQNAHKWWSQYFREYMFHNLLADKGYTVLDMDFRASSGYGRDWRTGIYRHMGGKDLSDNVDGARWLVENYRINPDRIGIYGGSYGGFITLMAQFTAPGIFAAGAALRPVTDWSAYNHPYTANILNEPATDSLAYRRSSPIYHAAGLKGKLLICHGMIDVNVHFQDVVRLAQRLIELGKDNWELAVYPLEDHGFTEASSWTDEYKRILKLFEEM